MWCGRGDCSSKKMIAERKGMDRLISLCRYSVLGGNKVGDTVFLIESNRIMRECTVKKVSGNLYVVRFVSGGSIQIKEHRLYVTQKEAESILPIKKTAK